MRDKQLEEYIKKTQTFLEFWCKFNHIFDQSICSASMDKVQGEDFIATRNLVNMKFEDLLDELGVPRARRIARCYPIYEILCLDDFSTMSDDKIAKLKDCWQESYIMLYSLLNRFKKKKKRIEKINGFILRTKRILTRGKADDKKRNRTKNS